MKVKVGKYTYEKSNKKNKKLMTTIDNKVIHFGDNRYEHFFDKTKIWSNLNHNDKERRKNYLTRSAFQKDGKGNLTKDNPLSPNFHARRILW
jgi:hypothetical protein